MSARHKIAIWAFAVLFAFLGLGWMFRPESAAAALGLTLGGTVALNTARGDLGGMFLAAAILCAAGVVTREGRWLQAVALVMGCIAAGRIVGLAVDGFALGSLLPLLLEIVMVVVLLLASRPRSEERFEATPPQ